MERRREQDDDDGFDVGGGNEVDLTAVCGVVGGKAAPQPSGLLLLVLLRAAAHLGLGVLELLFLLFAR